jgi:hypothetical protein
MYEMSMYDRRRKTINRRKQTHGVKQAWIDFFAHCSIHVLRQMAAHQKEIIVGIRTLIVGDKIKAKRVVHKSGSTIIAKNANGRINVSAHFFVLFGLYPM